jgi:hypothetical protein
MRIKIVAFTTINGTGVHMRVEAGAAIPFVRRRWRSLVPGVRARWSSFSWRWNDALFVEAGAFLGHLGMGWRGGFCRSRLPPRYVFGVASGFPELREEAARCTLPASLRCRDGHLLLGAETTWPTRARGSCVNFPHLPLVGVNPQVAAWEALARQNNSGCPRVPLALIWRSAWCLSHLIWPECRVS